jgi:Cu/Ag efflux protein CusF
MNKSLRATLTAAALGALSTLAFASGEAGTQVKPSEKAAMADGEVRKIDRSAGKVTLRHGEIKSLDMPPMTMVFRVKDPAMLDPLKDGDKVKFVAEKIGSGYTVTQLEVVK